MKQKSLTTALVLTLALVWGSMLSAQSAGEVPKPPSDLPPATAPAATRPAYPLWDGKENIPQYARRAGIKQAEQSLDLGKGVVLKVTLIPAGKFLMGPTDDEVKEATRLMHHNAGNPSDELPQHEVTLTKPFYMGVVTVTQAQYSQLMGQNPSTLKGALNPVDTVTWDDAVDFCKKLSEKTHQTIRLPTEAEWEYACRAGTKTPFNTGETIGVDQANYWGVAAPYGQGKTGVYRNKILPVGLFKPNAWGLYDMHGNVQQWCADWYDKGYYAQAPASDPTGPDSGVARVVRGAGYGFTPRDCRSAARDGLKPTAKNGIVSFRVVMELR